jgi:hypothetical protein
VPALLAVLLLVGACTKDGAEPPPASPVREGDVAETDALAKELCRRPPEPDLPPSDATTDLPPAVAAVVDQIEEVRGLEFLEPVRAEAVTHQELVSRLEKYFDYSYPESILGPRTQSWRTIGVIPPDADLREALHEFYSGQVIGFYDPVSTELVFIGSQDPTALERVTLAHELTHALDDQHFDLERLNALEAECRDEELAAGIGLAEGSAQFFATQWAGRFLSPEEFAEVAFGGGGSGPQGVPEFLTELQYWPYLQGLSFVAEEAGEGGAGAIDRAFEDPPVSTEQVIHPDRYPSDEPTAIGVPDLGPALGEGWTDIDVMTVGEEWLAAALDLHLDGPTAGDAAAGWDGGRYRTWSNGEDVAVALQTEWDSEDDAAAFAEAMEDWLDEADLDSRSEVLPAGSRVTVLWAPDDATLEAMRTGLA